MEKNNKDLLHRVTRLEDENEGLKVYTHTRTHTHTLSLSLPLSQSKLESQQTETYVTISTLQEERIELLALKDALQKYIRQLEQNNDDLERGKRSALLSVNIIAHNLLVMFVVHFLYVPLSIVCV